jgi:hypothetical protein
MCQTKPEFADGCHGGNEVPQIAGFTYIAIGPEFVTAENVLLGLGRAEDCDWNFSQNRVAF